MRQLEDLLQQCTVKLSIPGQLGWGTGFFVAPGLILTCAHVVKALVAPNRVRVRWQQQVNFAEAELVHRVPDLDLALLQFTPGDADLPCVYLDEALQTGQDLYFFGYPDEDFEHGCPVTGSCEGLTGDVSPLIKFKQAQVRPGMSGSALLNRQTGKVCGMVKFTRDRKSDLGGGAIPIGVILEQFPELQELQRGFHGRDRRWVNLITTQTEIDFQPYLQAIFTDEAYREWQDVYTPTTVEDRQRMIEQDTAIVSQRRVSSRLKLRAETVKLDKQKQGDQPDGAQETPERVEQWDVLAGLRNYAADHVVLIGKPGSGKSTSLERLLWEEAEKALQDPNARIPVLVKLRRCTGTIEALIRDFLVGHQIALEIAQIEELLRQGQFLLLLDGLNELPKAFETEVANFRDRYRRNTPMIVSTRDLGGGGTLGIEKTLKMLPLTEPQMREFVRGYLGEESDQLFQQLQGDRLRKFAETPLLLWMLCRVFAHNGKVPDNLGLAFREFAQLHDQELQADAPADSRDQWYKLLRHLAFVMMQGKTLIDPELSIPREEAENCLTAYLQQEDRANPRECAEQWLQDLLKYHLIQPVIQPNLEEHIEFRHQLIQEYYAAEYLLKLLPNLTDDQLKRDYLNYLKWTEPLALMLALENKEIQALRVVKLAMDEVDLMLGARLAGEVKASFQTKTIELLLRVPLPPELQIDSLAQTMSNDAVPVLIQALEEQDLEIRWRAVQGLGKIGSKASLPGLLKALEEDSSAVRDAVVEALVGMEAEITISALLDLLKHQNPFLRETAAYILGEVGNKTTISELLNVLNDQDPDVRLSAAIALGKLGDQSAVPCLLQALESQEIYTYREVARILGELGNEVAVPRLIKALEHEDTDVRMNTVYILEKYSSEVVILGLLIALNDPEVGIRIKVLDSLKNLDRGVIIPVLLKALEDEIVEVRIGAVETLGKLGSEADIPRLLKALEDENAQVRRAATGAIRELGHEAAIPGILHTLKHQNSLVRCSAVNALGNLGNAVAVPELLQTLKDDEDWYVRLNAVEALGEIGDTSAVPALLQLLEDQNLFVIRIAIALEKHKKSLESSQVFKEDDVLEDVGDKTEVLEVFQILIEQEIFLLIYIAIALGKLRSQIILSSLLEFLNFPDLYLRCGIVDALGKLGNEVAIPRLLEALEDQEQYVRGKAADALGKLGNEVAISGLLEALEDQEQYVRRKAADALGYLGSEVAIPRLIQALEDEDLSVRHSAGDALKKLCSEAVIPELLQALNNQNWKVRETAADILGKLGSEMAIPGLLSALEDSECEWEVRSSAARAIEKLDAPQVLADLWNLHRKQPEFYLPDTIASIQNRCQFYNYEIFQAHLVAEKADRSKSKNSDSNSITITTLKRLTIMTDKAPIFNQQHATIGVNYAAEGSTIEFTQHTSSSEQTFEILLTDYKQFIEQLQQKYPTLADATTVPQIIEVEAKLLEAQDQQRWQNFLSLKRFWNGSKKAGIKVGEHFAENNVWAKGAIAFLEGASEDVK